MRVSLFLLFVLPLVSTSCSHQAEVITNAQGVEFSSATLDEFFGDLMDTLGIPGMSIAIVNSSEIVYHQSLGIKELETDDRVEAQTLFEAASLSKPLFAYFVMQQVEKGSLTLDKPLYEYLPYEDIAHDERYKMITARMVLSHTTGFPNWRADTLEIQFEPGTQFQYSGEGYKYLAQVLAVVNDIPFSSLDSLFQLEVVEAIGADRLFFKWNEAVSQHKASGHLEGNPTNRLRDHKDNDFGAAGGLHTEASNYARFIISLIDHQLLQPSTTAEMFSEQIKLEEDDINALLLGATGWGLGFGIIPTTHGNCYWHAGNNDDFQSWMHFFPESGYAIILFTNSDQVQRPEFFQLFFDFMNDGISFDLASLG